jgi:hypothetical protein
MAQYVEVTDVDATLGTNWALEPDKARYVAMANAYLSALHVGLPDPVPDDIILAGSELAAAAADDLLYAQSTEGEMTSKKVKAGSASVEKSYAETSGSSVLPARVQFALALVAAYQALPMGITVGYGDIYGLA